MAGDAAFPSTTCMTLFFSLLLTFHFTMGFQEHSFSPLTSTKDGAKRRNTMLAASAREGSSQNSKTDMARKETAKSSHVPDQLQGLKRGLPQAPQPPLHWQNRIFNASAHEVPSGPNPISN